MKVEMSTILVKFIQLSQQQHYYFLLALYKKDNPNIIAYSKVMVPYLVFGLCHEWYKRGMVESPEDIISLINQQKSDENNHCFL